jgi:drug/metabolite transporter (DMT)-like permease
VAGIVLGLGAALGWGLADYIAAVTSQRISAIVAVGAMHVVSVAVLLVVAGLTGSSLGFDRHVPQLVGLGALSAFTFVALYRGLALGPLSLVSPIVSAYAALTVVLAVALLGDRLSAVQAAAIGTTIAGIVLVSARLERVRLERGTAAGVFWGFAAMLGLGELSYQVGAYSQEEGWLQPVLATRAFACLFLVPVLAYVVRGGEDARRLRADGRLGAAMLTLGLLDVCGWILFNVGVRHAQVSFVAAASAWYPLVPLVFAVVLLRERPARNQWLGIALILGGLSLLGAAA